MNLTCEEDDLIGKPSSGTVVETISGDQLANTEMNNNQKSRRSSRREKRVEDTMLAGGRTVTDAGSMKQNISIPQSTKEDHVSSNSSSKSSSAESSNESHIRHQPVEPRKLSDLVFLRYLWSLARLFLRASYEWLERLEPLFIATRLAALNSFRYIQVSIEHASPTIIRWSMNFGKVMLLVLMLWLECALRGLNSILHMGTTSFFTVLWCSVLSVIAMVGIFKFLMAMVVVTVIGLFTGLRIAMLLIVTAGLVLIWYHGSFWIIILVIFSGGVAFLLKHERLALFIATSYSVYCAWGYVGWLGLLIGFNLSFMSSEALIVLLKDIINEQIRANGSAETDGSGSRPGFFPTSSGETGADSIPTQRGSGIPSTSGSDSEMTSDDEVSRLLACNDHYTALGLSRFQDIDVSVIKREYRKKAMLVHPDKNLNNLKASEAFTKLQNAYEVLLDSHKRKTYDDELRREELLNYFSRFQETSRKNGQCGFFTSGSAREDANDEEYLAESRRIACRKCGTFHIWVYTKKVKLRARWCQECKDYHSAKDGDGWVEQLSHPILFGTLQKMDPPAAYVCANNKIYNATEWYSCQGMSCAANAHKPSFHVSTNVTSKHSGGRGHRTGGKGGPNLEENMTEGEFFEWFQNAVQTGAFDNLSGRHSDASQSAGTGSSSKHGGGGRGSSNPKPKKRGKK